MKSSLVRSVAIAAACAAGLSASLTTVPAVAATADPASKTSVSNFGYKASVFGTKLLVNGVEVRTLRDADLQLPCTRRVGVEESQPSVGSLPIANDLIKIAASTSTSKTYRAGSINGIRAVNTVADIALGGEVGGVATPVLKIQGLQSVADSFFDKSARGGKGAFGEDHSFSFKGMSLELPESSPVPAPVQDLLDILNQVTAPINQIVNQVIALLVENLGTIEIPGLGAISLGKATGKTGAGFASSEAYALKILVNATGENTVLQLGRASSRIARPVPAGVFRSTMSALELNALNGAVALGGIANRSIPCEGTKGKVVRSSVASANLLLQGEVIGIKGITYAYKGLQKGKSAKGFSSTSIGEVTIPALDLIIKGLSSRVDVSTKGKGKIQRKISTTFSSVTIGGKEVFPKPGKPVSFDGGVLEMLKKQDGNFYGTKITGFTLTLFEQSAVLDLAQTSARIVRQ